MELSWIREQIPKFEMEHFDMFDEVVSLKWESFSEDVSLQTRKRLVLELHGGAKYSLTLEFSDVDSFRFEGNGQISGFYMKDMSQYGYEKRARYEIGDYEEGLIKFYCSDIVIKSFYRIKD